MMILWGVPLVTMGEHWTGASTELEGERRGESIVYLLSVILARFPVGAIIITTCEHIITLHIYMRL